MMCRRLCIVSMFCFYGRLFCSENINKQVAAYPESFSENDKKWLKSMNESMKQSPEGSSNINLRLQIVDNIKRTTSSEFLAFGTVSIVWGALLYSISLV